MGRPAGCPQREGKEERKKNAYLEESTYMYTCPNHSLSYKEKTERERERSRKREKEREKQKKRERERNLFFLSFLAKLNTKREQNTLCYRNKTTRKSRTFITF